MIARSVTINVQLMTFSFLLLVSLLYTRDSRFHFVFATKQALLYLGLPQRDIFLIEIVRLYTLFKEENSQGLNDILPWGKRSNYTSTYHCAFLPLKIVRQTTKLLLLLYYIIVLQYTHR